MAERKDRNAVNDGVSGRPHLQQIQSPSSSHDAITSPPAQWQPGAWWGANTVA
jgi:hypothetical protein